MLPYLRLVFLNRDKAHASLGGSGLRHVSLSAIGQDQVLTIPHEFALSGTEVLLRKEGNRLIIEPIRPGSLLSLLTTLEDITDNFPDTDKGLPALDDITL